MKNIRTRALVLMLLVVLLLGSCEFLDSRIRKLPPVIELYNSALQKTLKLLPNDTLYVKVSGLAATTWYDVEVRDTAGTVISAILAESDADGVIQPTAIWYDIGFKWVNGKMVLASEAELGLSAFEVHVTTHAESASIARAGATDFGLDFFIVYNTQIARPQPIVMAGERVGGVFNLENALDAGDSLYVKVANMSDLPPDTTYATIYVVPFAGQNYEDGSSIGTSDQLFITQTVTKGTQDWTDLTTGNGLLINWPVNGSNPQSKAATIDSADQGKAFSVFLDVNNNGIFDVLQQGTTDYYLDGVDGNGVAGFIVRQPPITNAQLVQLNLVSGGIFTYNWSTYQYDYDYRDFFRKDGADTKVAYYYGVGPGVKVIWNPYAYYQGWNNDPTNGAGLYYGRYVDLYIVKAQTAWGVGDSLTDPTRLIRHLRLPVQYGCANGLNQQTIWPAPMVPGDYALILDMTKDGSNNWGTISNGDVIDELGRNGSLRTVGGKRTGFSIMQ